MTFLDRWLDFSIFNSDGNSKFQRERENSGNKSGAGYLKTDESLQYPEQIFFLLGKGGTGKTTNAVALGRALAAKDNKNVLIVSLDSAHNLGDVAGKSLTSEPIKICQNLFGLEVDLDKTVDNYLERTMKQMKSIYNYLQIFNLDHFLDLLQDTPGIQEFAILEAIGNILTENNEYDIIIFDTAPTGMTLRTLSLPRLTLKWIENLIELRKKILDKRKMVENIKGTQKVKLGDKQIELPVEVGDDRVLQELKDYYEEIEGIQQLITNKQVTTGIMVMNPDQLSALETERALKKLFKNNFPLKIAVVNRLSIEETNEELVPEIEELKNDFPKIEWISQPEISGARIEKSNLIKMGKRILGTDKI